MASLTPGVLSKLLDNANNEQPSSTGHRSAVLQVTEIVPSLSNNPKNPWQSKGFFLKVSDSLHSTYVSISEQDLDLIYSDKIQLGQFVYVSKLELHPGSPVPCLRGLKPVFRKRQACVGNPKELVSGELLSAVRGSSSSSVGFKENGVRKGGVVAGSMKCKSGSKEREGLDARRLSLDSARRAWEHTKTPKSKICSSNVTSGAPSGERPKSSRSVDCEKKVPSKNELARKQSSLNTPSPLKSKNGISSPEVNNKPLKKDIKSASDSTVPSCLVKVPLKSKTWLDQRISWNALPPEINDLGKGTVRYRDTAFFAAVCALEEASAVEGVLCCLQSFAEICESSQKIAPGSLIEQYLDFHHSMQRSAAKVDSLLATSIPEAELGNNSSLNFSVDDRCTTTTGKNAMSWVHAAIEANLSKFSLFKKPEKIDIMGGRKCHYVILETRKESDSENLSPQNKPNRRHANFLSKPSTKRFPSPSLQHSSTMRKTIFQGEDGSSKSRLKDTASLAEKLLLFSCEWFLKYMEDLLKEGFGLCVGEGSEIAFVLKQLKRVNVWLDDLTGTGLEVDGKIEGLKKKIYGFLLEYVDSAIVIGK